MIRKYHNYTLQTSPRHREEEPQNIFSKKTSKRQQKQSNQLSLFLARMITKLELHKAMNTKTKTNTEPLHTMGGT